MAVNRLTGDFIISDIWHWPLHQIQVYNQHGQFQRTFGANSIQYARGITVDFKGQIVVIESKVSGVSVVCTVLDSSEPNRTAKKILEPEPNRTVKKSIFQLRNRYFLHFVQKKSKNLLSNRNRTVDKYSGTELNCQKISWNRNRTELPKRFLEPREPNRRFGSVQNWTVHTTGVCVCASFAIKCYDTLYHQHRFRRKSISYLSVLLLIAVMIEG